MGFLLILCLSLTFVSVFAEKCNMIHLTATVWDLDCSNRAILQLPIYFKDRPVVNFNGHNSSLSSNITFKGWDKLKSLDLSFNNLTVFENHTLEGFKELDKLNLSYCSLQTIKSSQLKGSVLIKVLDLSGNPELSSSDVVTVVNSSVHKGTVSLLLENMGLKNFSDDAWASANSLRRLHLRDNLLENLPVFPHRLYYLDISNNSYSVLKHDPFQNCTDLRTLVARDNAFLQDVDEDAFAYLPNLTILALDGNRKLEFLPNGVFFHNHHLTQLSLSGCGFKVVPIEFKPIFLNLAHLSLSGNPWDCSPSNRWLSVLNSSVIADIRCNGNTTMNEFFGDLRQTVLKHVIVVVVCATFTFFFLGIWFVYDLEKKRKSDRPYWPLGKRHRNPLASSIYVSTVV